MQRSSLSVLVVLVTAACGPAMGDGAEEGSADAEGAVTLTTVAPKTATTSLLGGTTTANATLVRSAPIQADSCVNYDPIMAAIGSRTIDCLGTVGPKSYGIDDKGRLVPRFQKCTQDPPPDGEKDVYGDILALLSIQNRKEASDAIRCMGGRYQKWLDTFAGSGIQTCPVWKRIETLNAPTESTIKDIVSTQPKLPVAKPDTIPETPHENYLMDLKFPDGAREGRCKDEADCARKCAGGFPSLWVEGEGTKAIIDPTYWLIGINFGSSTNPFLQGEYYHAMSLSGTIPGALYGHRNRAGEPCSRWVIDEHVLLSLQLDCIDPAIVTTCITVCSEPLPDTAGTEANSPY